MRRRIQRRRSRTTRNGSSATGRLWGGLKRAWKGYKISRAEGDVRLMREYAGAIRKFQERLGLRKTRFRLQDEEKDIKEKE